ncbi:PASTA domain-containing protein [Subtercola boreus]|uniref:PASTA domain-containing protein n=1 Tax=Subtercola boreus TaxID=120213 RepID=UPI0011C02CA5|nr:PASTA domain-containing protein [Subtercola boreus]
MVERFAKAATVPDVIGLPFHVGRELAYASGVTLANPDPDGPPISALAWPGLFYITAQEPAAGTTVYQWDSVTIEIIEHGTAETMAVPDGTEPPSEDATHAIPQRESYVDLTDQMDSSDY